MNLERLKKLAEAARVKCGLSEDELKAIHNACRDCYREIAYDLVPDNPSRGTCKRSTVMAGVMEMLLDPNGLKHYLDQTWLDRLLRNEFCGGRWTPAIAKALDCRETDYATLKALVGPAFPFTEYEVGDRENDC